MKVLEKGILARLALAWKVLVGSPTYVVIYDREVGDAEVEEYYGYFDTPKEASRMYETAFGDDPKIMEGRTKLCLIVEDWN